jgi:hypothetical protein
MFLRKAISYWWPINPEVAPVARVVDTDVKQTPQPKSIQNLQSQYEERVKKYKAEIPPGLSPLAKHILYVIDNNFVSSPASVATRLKAMDSSMPDFKGWAIHLFNAGHRGNTCPFFKKLAQGGLETASLSSSLHLGTTRCWNANGSVNEDCWKRLVSATAEMVKGTAIITKTKFFAALKKWADEDPEDKTTGRQVSPLMPFSKEVQHDAGVKAWEEIFDRLTCGYKDNTEPYITVEVMREFFDDSPVAYLRAECGLLPASKPQIALDEVDSFEIVPSEPSKLRA